MPPTSPAVSRPSLPWRGGTPHLLWRPHVRGSSRIVFALRLRPDASGFAAFVVTSVARLRDRPIVVSGQSLGADWQIIPLGIEAIPVCGGGYGSLQRKNKCQKTHRSPREDGALASREGCASTGEVVRLRGAAARRVLAAAPRDNPPSSYGRRSKEQSCRFCRF